MREYLRLGKYLTYVLRHKPEDLGIELDRDGFDPRIHLAYSVEYFKKQPTFEHYYDEIKRLLTMENRVVLGHSITADVQYLNMACERYEKDKNALYHKKISACCRRNGEFQL